MHHRRRPPAAALAALLVLAVPSLAACGSGGAGSGAESHAKPVADRSTLPKPTTLVLRAQDIGAGYLVAPDGTQRTTLKQELQHESARARTADRHAWVGGYTVTFVHPGDAGVVSEAIVYRDARSARVVSTDRTGLAYGTRSMHAHAIRAPRSAPGQARFMVSGRVRGLPLYAYGWQQGSVVELVALFGRHVTVPQLMKLARTQDLRLTHPTFGA
jgi:hypothetical protein